MPFFPSHVLSLCLETPYFACLVLSSNVAGGWLALWVLAVSSQSTFTAEYVSLPGAPPVPGHSWVTVFMALCWTYSHWSVCTSAAPLALSLERAGLVSSLGIQHTGEAQSGVSLQFIPATPPAPGKVVSEEQ